MRPARPWLNGLRALILLLAAAGGSAQAAVYTGIWDPRFGDPFTNLGWRGSATFTVPANCPPQEGEGSPPCPLGTVSNARVEFYDASIAGVDQPTLATLAFADASFTVLQTVFNGAGLLTQIATSASNSVAPDVDLSNFLVGPSTVFSLQFTLADGPRLSYRSCPSNTAEACTSGINDATAFPARFTITPASTVAEPATPWLGGLALAALLLARRRRLPMVGH